MAPAVGFELVFSASAFVFFSWGVRGHFRSTGAMQPGMRLISAVSLLAFLWFCLRLPFTSRAAEAAGWPLALQLFALLLFTLSIAIFSWAVFATRRAPPTLAFDTDQPAILYRSGPYRYVRHPFYLAYLMFWTGTSVATPGWFCWLTPLIMLLLYANAAWREERKFASSKFAKAYAEYRTQAGMFLPRAWSWWPQ